MFHVLVERSHFKVYNVLYALRRHGIRELQEHTWSHGRIGVALTSHDSQAPFSKPHNGVEHDRCHDRKKHTGGGEDQTQRSLKGKAWVSFELLQRHVVCIGCGLLFRKLELCDLQPVRAHGGGVHASFGGGDSKGVGLQTSAGHRIHAPKGSWETDSGNRDWSSRSRGFRERCHTLGIRPKLASFNGYQKGGQGSFWP